MTTQTERLRDLELRMDKVEELHVELINLKQRITIGIWILAGLMVGLKSLPDALQILGAG